ncbi:hypothetical protein G3T36_10930 [Diaminobutyricibacter tongyongensis]|uniref:Protein kinase domain-containing protein n=1 Tax=Leifsonia tongyongensis TaxID=1268043 RepID=A0A6L9XYV1_9MICO|nr:hypothetical protein [Diaminobutyricibacter tongyongensis]NEN06387.1 hypothetical protein [Diaminobutyricibacter tongyongensis]
MTRRRERTAQASEARLELRVDAAAASVGLRVLRELGDGGTSRVCLVVPRDADPLRSLDASRAAMKVPRFEAVSDRRVREDRVLASVRSPHVVALLGTPDAGTGTLLLEHLPGGTLGELLARREFLRIGEAVTIVVSLVRALAVLHAAGYRHGSLSSSKVMFAADGRPVLVGLSHAVAVAPSPMGGAAPAESADDAGFREIVGLVASAVGDAAIEPAVAELMALTRPGLAESMDPAAWLQLETRIFRVGRPEPVLLVPLSAPLISAAGRGAPTDAVRRPGEATMMFRARFGGDRLAGLLRLARQKRKLLIYSAGCILVTGAVVVALVAPPSGDRGRAATAATDAPSGARHEALAPSSVAPTNPSPTPTPGASPAAVSEAQPVDPVDAAARLLRARFECFASNPADEHCLDAVLQPGSAMEGSDRADLRLGDHAASAARRDYRAHEVSLIERMGDAALLALTPSAASTRTDGTSAQTKPASLLIVRGEAGWRLRELFEN